MNPLYILLFSILLAAAHIFLMKKPRTLKKMLEVIFMYVMFISVGLTGVLAFYGHVFMGPEIAAKIGWKGGSPFQYEVGVADLSFGVIALLIPWIRGTYWIAAALVNAIFLIGCAVGHIRDLMIHGNTAVYNAGPVLWIGDLLVPVLILALAGVISRKK
jgi:hypothetical protein